MILPPRVLLVGASPTNQRIAVGAFGREQVEVVADAGVAFQKLGAGAPYDLVLYETGDGLPSGRQLHDEVERAYPHETPSIALIAADSAVAEAYSMAGMCVLPDPIDEAMVRGLLEQDAAESAEFAERRAG